MILVVDEDGARNECRQEKNAVDPGRGIHGARGKCGMGACAGHSFKLSAFDKKACRVPHKGCLHLHYQEEDGKSHKAKCFMTDDHPNQRPRMALRVATRLPVEPECHYRRRPINIQHIHLIYTPSIEV